MNPKIKLRRSASAIGKKIDAGEPMFDLQSGKLYISKADNKTIGTDAEVVEIGGGGGGDVSNIDCNTIVVSRDSNSGSTIQLKNNLNSTTVEIGGENGANSGYINVTGTVFAQSVILSGNVSAEGAVNGGAATFTSCTVGGDEVMTIKHPTGTPDLNDFVEDGKVAFCVAKDTSSSDFIAHHYPSVGHAWSIINGSSTCAYFVVETVKLDNYHRLQTLTIARDTGDQVGIYTRTTYTGTTYTPWVVLMENV